MIQGNVYMEEQNETVTPRAIGAEENLPPLDAKGLARRRFARAGAGATGVILTLHSQPGMATYGKLCNSPSGFTSMTPNASSNPRFSCSYNRSHGYWKNHQREWKTHAGVDPETKFGKIFRCSGSYAELYNVPLIKILNPSKEIKAIDRNNVAMQTIAAYLNARASRYAGVPSVMPEEHVLEIWSAFVTRGYYLPAPGARPWNGAVIAAYFESTFR